MTSGSNGLTNDHPNSPDVPSHHIEQLAAVAQDNAGNCPPFLAVRCGGLWSMAAVGAVNSLEVDMAEICKTNGRLPALKWTDADFQHMADLLAAIVAVPDRPDSQALCLLVLVLPTLGASQTEGDDSHG